MRRLLCAMMCTIRMGQARAYQDRAGVTEGLVLAGGPSFEWESERFHPDWNTAGLHLICAGDASLTRRVLPTSPAMRER